MHFIFNCFSLVFCFVIVLLFSMVDYFLLFSIFHCFLAISLFQCLEFSWFIVFILHALCNILVTSYCVTILCIIPVNQSILTQQMLSYANQTHTRIELTYSVVHYAIVSIVFCTKSYTSCPIIPAYLILS